MLSKGFDKYVEVNPLRLEKYMRKTLELINMLKRLLDSLYFPPSYLHCFIGDHNLQHAAMFNDGIFISPFYIVQIFKLKIIILLFSTL